MAEELLTDDEQWEAIKRWLSENGLWLVAGCALGAAILFGFRFYQAHRTEVQLHAAEQFESMSQQVEKNDRAAARRTGTALLEAYPGTPYADQAELLLARLAIDEGRVSEAVAPLTHVMNSSKDTELQVVARLRLARVLIDLGKPDAAVSTLAVTAPAAYASRFHEVRGDAMVAKKDVAAALTEYRAALAGGDGRGSDATLLNLKIADLGVSP